MTDEHLKALGRVTVGYSHVELAVSGFIWKLLAPDQRVGQTVTASLMFSARITLLRALFDLLTPAYGPELVNVKALDAALRAAEDAVSKRNAVVHSLLWLLDPEGGDVSRMRLKPKRAAEWASAPASVSDLMEIAEQLTKAGDGVSQCMLQHFDGFGVDKAWGPKGAGSLFGLTATGAFAFERSDRTKDKC